MDTFYKIVLVISILFGIYAWILIQKERLINERIELEIKERLEREWIQSERARREYVQRIYQQNMDERIQSEREQRAHDEIVKQFNMDERKLTIIENNLKQAYATCDKLIQEASGKKYRLSVLDIVAFDYPVGDSSEIGRTAGK